MAKGNRIIVSPAPVERFERIIVIGTPKPGTCMEINTAAGLSGLGRFSYDPAGFVANVGTRGMAADGDRIPVCVLLCFQDTVECPPGRIATDAYVTGDPGAVYWPFNGDDLNVLYQNQAGTADDVAIGDKGIIDDGTGKVLVSTGSPECEPWRFNETLTDPVADALLWATYCGM